MFDGQFLVCLTKKTAVPYLDDCIISFSTAEEHIQRLRELHEKFRSANLKKATKFEFFRTRGPFIGHIISKNGLEPNPSKIAAVRRFPIPTNETEVKSSFGLCSYYHPYIKKFGEIARALHNWTPEAQNAFET